MRPEIMPNKEQTLRIANVICDSIVDGPGLRTVIFVQGCPHHCIGCHNPESWDYNKGTEITVGELLEKIQRNPLCKGITFSGGEPFEQAWALAELAKRLKCSGYEIACYTGYTYEFLYEKGTPSQKELLNQLDVLVDGPFILEQRSLEIGFKGSKNQRIINVKKSLCQKEVVLMNDGRWQ